MHLSLGIDTGGTHTDAVLFDDLRGVIAKAKALTTRHDLAIGISQAVTEVVRGGGEAPGFSVDDIGLVSLSTTLATNAIVEGRGGRVALVLIGFDEAAGQRAGLVTALGGDPLVRIGGGHNAHGDQVAPLDIGALKREALALVGTVTGFAITSQFSTRNPEHEISARDTLTACTGLPVTCGHELSAALDGPRRAVTSVLNARLIGLIANLIAAARAIMGANEIDAPLMVVRGDGSLMSADVALLRPIETVLSGPAASLVGAAFLTGSENAIVSDIGGTTTDAAVIQAGSPTIDVRGATVGGYRTMVQAAAITTIGLGGDSELVVDSRGPQAVLSLGPRRVVPVSLAAVDHPDIVHRALDRQLRRERANDHDAAFVLPVTEAGATDAGLDQAEADLLARARRGVAPLSEIIRNNGDVARLERLVARGLVAMSGFTPTDGSHVLGEQVTFDALAARKAAALMARQRSSVGQPVADGAETLSRLVVDLLRRRSAEMILDVALGVDGFEQSALSRHPVLAASLDGRRGVVDVSARLTVPLVAVGAAASIHYSHVATLLRTDVLIPDDADVANAVGAVVGRVRVETSIYVSRFRRNRFRVHHRLAGDDTVELADALASATDLARSDVAQRATDAGAIDPEIVVRQHLNTARVEGEDYFVDATVTASASGRPRRSH